MLVRCTYLAPAQSSNVLLVLSLAFSPGQRAMAMAMLYPEPEKGGRGKKSSIKRVADTPGFPHRVKEARAVLKYSRELAEAVMRDGKPLQKALTEARLSQGSVRNDRARLTKLPPPGERYSRHGNAFAQNQVPSAMPRTTTHRRAAQSHPKGFDSERRGFHGGTTSPGGAQETLCLKLDAERKGGKILAGMSRHPGNRTDLTCQHPVGKKVVPRQCRNLAQRASISGPAPAPLTRHTLFEQ